MGYMPTVVSTQAFDSSQFTYAAAHKSFGAFRKQQGSSMIRRAEARICVRKTRCFGQVFPSALPGENATA
jgi:hypothetical protein